MLVISARAFGALQSKVREDFVTAAAADLKRLQPSRFGRSPLRDVEAFVERRIAAATAANLKSRAMLRLLLLHELQTGCDPVSAPDAAASLPFLHHPDLPEARKVWMLASRMRATALAAKARAAGRP